MTGPCLCGDPYCPHCGNVDPRVEKFAELVSELMTPEQFQRMANTMLPDGAGWTPTPDEDEFVNWLTDFMMEHADKLHPFLAPEPDYEPPT